MKQKLAKNYTLFFSQLFPWRRKNIKSAQKAPFSSKVVLGVGGNIGNSKQIFSKLVLFLESHGCITLLATSPLLKNPPFGYFAQNDFFNAVIVIHTSLSPKALLKITQKIEKRFKRVKNFQDGPRPLDIDIIFYGQKRLKSHKLTLPHPRWHERASVLIPMEYV